MSGIFSDLWGTSKAFFKIGIHGVRLKNNNNNLVIRDSSDSSDAEVTASKINVSGDSIVINSDSGSTSSDWKLNLQRNSTEMTQDLTFILPATNGTSGQAIVGDGTGKLAWASVGDTSLCDKVNLTSIGFGDTSPKSILSLGALDVINLIEINVDTVFDGVNPSLSIGILGNTSKYSSASDIDLKTVGGYLIHPGLIAQGIENLIATFNTDSSTTGSIRILIHYATPKV